MQAYKRPRTKGAAIVETAASLALFLPILVLIIYVVLEASFAYLIQSAMNEGARQACRDLAVAYGQDPSIAGDRFKEELQVFDKIRVNNMINNSAQFGDPVWNSSATPPTVEVTLSYLPNQYGLPPFPNPDVLHLGNMFRIRATATYRLE